MGTYIRHIETIVPDTRYDQGFIRQIMERNVAADRRLALYLRQAYARSGIDARHSVIRDFAPDRTGQLFFKVSEGGRLESPSTGRRNDIFVRESRKLAGELVQKALKASGFSAGDFTHLVTVSCTGFSNPGIDFFLVKDLGLPDHVRRFHLGFMGCYAAFPALKMAASFCAADPEAVVLVVCLELNTIHIQFNANEDSILAGSVFSDGASAAIVSGGRPSRVNADLELVDFHSAIVPGSEDGMAWTIGNNGFDIALSHYVPRIIEANICPFLDELIRLHGIETADVDKWAIHPGGKAIIDKIEKAMNLRPEQSLPSREVLRRFGNMSSATILFVLKDILERSGPAPMETVVALAFGPGLTMEACLLHKHQRQVSACSLPATASDEEKHA